MKKETLKNKIKEEEKEEYYCDICEDTGYVEVMGDGDNFEWDVVDIKMCECQLED